jgi:YgiT-type zinc finger domain-containing protein
MMKCVICKVGELAEGSATVTLERGDATLVFKHVPAQVCANCGEEYVDESVTRQVLSRAEASITEGVKLDVREYQAA